MLTVSSSAEVSVSYRQYSSSLHKNTVCILTGPGCFPEGVGVIFFATSLNLYVVKAISD